MNFDNIEEEDIGTTKGGFKYIEVETDDKTLKLRNSHRPDRIKEDSETYDEYKVRRDVLKEYTKDRKRGETIWPSSQYGTLTKEKADFLFNLAKQQNNEKSS